MATVVLDTSVLIALLKNADTHHQSAVKATSVRNEYLISAVTLGEALISAFRINEKSGRTRHQFISTVVNQIVPIDEEIAIRAAQIRAVEEIARPGYLFREKFPWNHYRRACVKRLARG